MTVRITTKRPWVDFPSYLGGSRFGIMAQAQLDDKTGCNTKLIGTGPFKFVSWQPNVALKAVRNPDYWQIAPDGKPYPYVDSIEFRPVVEGAQRINASRAVRQRHAHLQRARHRQHAHQAARRRQGQHAPDPGRHRARLPHDQRVEATVRRRAHAPGVRHGRRPQEINDVLGEGYPTVADGPFAPGTMAYLKDPGFPKHDVAGAKRLVQEYEKGGGKAEFTITLVTDPAVIQVGEMVQQQIAKAGFRVKLVNARNRPKLISDAIGGNFQAMTFRNHSGDDPDGSTCGGTRALSNPVNFGRISDPVIDKLLDEGRSELDPVKRQRIYQDLNREFARKVWNIWLSYTPWAVVESPTSTASSALISARRRGQAVPRSGQRSPGARHVDLPVNRRAIHDRTASEASFTDGERRSVTIDTSAVASYLAAGLHSRRRRGFGTADGQESSDNSPAGSRGEQGGSMTHGHRSSQRSVLVRLAIALTALALVASACGGKSSSSNKGGKSGFEGDKSGESSLADAGKPKRGGHLIYGLEAETGGGYCLSEGQLAISGIMVARALYDTLTVPNAAGVYTPYLAQSYSHSPDYKVWHIALRPNIKFHDGSPLTAEVVKNNFEAYRGKYPGRSSLLLSFVLNNIDSETSPARSPSTST